ncbi:MAG: hypothetical protein HY329_05050 [Chloroflexi bacterium]|nr:hypothetical protein [Chloroflexota bacterium]
MTTASTGSDTNASLAALLSSREQLLGYVRRKLDDPELAEDILQESLVKALRAAPELRDQERLVP